MVATGISVGVVILGVRSEAGRALIEADCAMYARKSQRRHERHGELADNIDRPVTSSS
jgi:hypothetical protein